MADDENELELGDLPREDTGVLVLEFCRLSSASAASRFAPKSLVQSYLFLRSERHASSQARFASAAEACVTTPVSMLDWHKVARASIPPAAQICRHITSSLSVMCQCRGLRKRVEEKGRETKVGAEEGQSGGQGEGTLSGKCSRSCMISLHVRPPRHCTHPCARLRKARAASSSSRSYPKPEVELCVRVTSLTSACMPPE